MVVDAAHNRGNMAVALLARDMVFHEMAARKRGFMKQEPPSLGLHNGGLRAAAALSAGMKPACAPARPSRTGQAWRPYPSRRKSNHNDLELGAG